MTTDKVTKQPVEIDEASRPFFETQLSPDELERILARIEENLVFRQQFNPQPLAGSVAALEQRLQAIRELRAPYYRPELSQGVGVWLRRALNYVLGLFGHKQALYNTQLIEALHTTVLYFHQELTAQRQSVVVLQAEIEQLHQQLAATFAAPSPSNEEASLRPDNEETPCARP